MKKNCLILIISIIILIVIIGAIFINREYPDDENTLYSIKFDDFKLKFQRYDYALGQNQLVAVEKSTNKGKNYERITDELITVSMQSKFVFLNEKLGFAISSPNLTKDNNYQGFKVTKDGGKSFVNATINYDNPDVSILTVEDVPYYEKDVLHVKCSIYQVKEDGTGYEEVELIFISLDEGLTWYIEDENYDNIPVIERLDNMTNLIKDKLVEKGHIKEDSLESLKVLSMYIDGYYIEDKDKVYAQVEYIYTYKGKKCTKIVWVITDEKEVYDVMNGISLNKSDIDSGRYIKLKEEVN